MAVRVDDLVALVGQEAARVLVLQYGNEKLPAFALYEKMKRDAEIVTLWNQGVSLPVISERKNVSISTVRRAIQKYRN